MLASVFDTVTGLPTHILVVHAVVVLVPLCFIGVCIAAASQKVATAPRRSDPRALAVAFVSSLIAVKSGKALRARLGATPTINHHAHLGVWVPVFVAVALALTWWWFVVEDRAGTISLRSEPAPDAPTRDNSPSRNLRLTAAALAVVSCAVPRATSPGPGTPAPGPTGRRS